MIGLEGLSIQHNQGLGCVESRLQFWSDLIYEWVTLIARPWPPGISSDSLINLCLFSSEKPQELHLPKRGLTLAL